MKPVGIAALALALGLLLCGQLWAGGRHGPALRTPGFVAVTPHARIYSGYPAYRYVSPRYPHVYYYANGYYHQPYYPNVVVVSPYAPAYILPPTLVVTQPYFCVLHNEGFISRIGLLDHLSGTHKIPLDATANLCPDGVGSCVFPSY